MWFNNNLSSWGLIQDLSGQDGPDNLCEPTSADSKNPESAIWSSRQCLPVLGSLLCSISQSNCWVCGALPSSSVEGFWRWTSPLQGKDFLHVCEYLRQQSHAMPLLHLMTFTNPKMDWCNTLYFNYGHNVTFNFDYTFSRFNDYFATYKANRSRSNGFLPVVYQIWNEVIWLTPEKGRLISTAL